MYGFTMHVPAPIELYHSVHQAVVDIIAEEGGGDGLILHLAYETDEGFDLIEVWETKEQSDSFNATVTPKAMERAGVPMVGPPPETEEFDPVGVLTPRIFTPDARV